LGKGNKELSKVINTVDENETMEERRRRF